MSNSSRFSGRWVFELIVGAAIAVAGIYYTNVQKEISTKQRYIELSVQVLTQKYSEDNKPIRAWAVDLLNHYAPEGLKLDSNAKNALIHEQLKVYNYGTTCPDGYELGPDGWTCIPRKGNK